MLVVVRKPPIEFSIKGTVPEKLIRNLVREYGPDNVSMEYDDMMNAMDMDWFKEESAKDTPGRTLRFYRKLAGMTQPELAAKLGTTKQIISNMENDKKPISRMMAHKLAEIFDVPAARFI
ncbi:MAG: helix-turn-helix transcriptional regulator [Spirochaetes bacterium]|uniref:Helix-turn-helix transcriptional regulator n=1 Tax=Candidatus Ornithospirochaeta stercoravium TaxID=2840897 RepID=A0A9D9IE55_9SPIO|nr:helix-turn-helix transcriptional regulator [Candidatus Ornithospirochaeta stercoravium]